MGRLRRFVLAPLVVLIAVAGLASAVDPAAARRAAVVGAAGAGDPYFPRQGNGGYEAQHYSVHISYSPVSRVLHGVVTMFARSVLDLRRFDLDLRATMHVSSVVVDGRRATFTQPASAVQELVITPARVLATGHHFVVTVTYSGRPGEITDADGSPDGWIRTDDGAFVADEPQGMPTWMPVNDTPRDKATYTVLINTPRIYGAISNGRLSSIRTYRTSHTYTWVLRQPVSSYLVTATIGRFKLYRGITASGIPYVNAIDPTLLRSGRAVLAKLPAVIDYSSARFGRYPFDAVGGVVDNVPRVGYALETATRPIFDTTPSVQTLSHELAHQWFGDDVTLKRWRDIWLHEGFAEFCSWLWDEHTGVQSAASHLREVMSRPASSSSTWNPPPGNPGSAGAVFSDSVYVRGAAALQVLRQKVGDTTFFRILHGWVAAHRYGKATVGEFTVYAERVAHRDLTPFFQRWLYRSGKP